MNTFRLIFAPALVLTLCVLTGCGKREPERVTVYCALDDEFSRPLLDEFSKQTGIEVLTKLDTESTKTVGLAEAILAEAKTPRCDLFWNNEILHTLRLDRAGLLAEFDPPDGANYPPQFRSADGRWFGFAARARVLIVNTNRVAEARRPTSIRDLRDVQWYDRVGIAKPLFGTTATHAACLFATWGDDEAKEFFAGIKRNARIMSGNRQVARAVANGELDFGLTDTDDAMVEVAAGAPVAIVYPDQGEGEVGTLFIPNTLAVIKGSPHEQNAKRLAAWLLTAEVEGRLAAGPSAQIPLHSDTTAAAQVETPATVNAMEVDFEKAADAWNEASAWLRDEFTAGG